ncbi:protein kinase [Brevibacterium sp. LS14]|uniref:Serine/threonine protein kinase n=1 Tax=Brevibacterium casei S18 TaxID=1229781 RepID=K9ALP5_9MICO|nr:hypothetical protein [Brevibacterium casei]EKU48288.1 serine/threonine protein kinase [Brevibacterium casei S18]NJE66288.1 protein kinase [Brevibacterium sp. LS14]QZE25642.1 protein kinase [Brevibacterium casei]
MSDVPPRPRIRPATSDDWVPTDRSGRGAQARPQGQDQDPNPAEAEFDRSTYYEYIERHTGDFPVSQTRRSNVFAPAGSSPFQDHINARAPEPARGGGRGGPRRTGEARNPNSGGFPAQPGYAGGSSGRGTDSGGFAAVPAYGGPDSGQTQSVRPRRSTGLKVVVVILAIVMVLALVGFFGIRWLAPETGTVPADVSGEPTSQAPSPSDELVQPSASPEEELDGFVESGAEKAAALEGQWVTQVSAKQVGTEADGKTWSAQDILDEFKANQVKYPGAILLDSSEWKAYKTGGYWVTVIDTPYKDSGPALEQCRSWGLDRDHCLAKRLVKDGEYSEKNSAYLDK